MKIRLKQQSENWLRIPHGLFMVFPEIDDIFQGVAAENKQAARITSRWGYIVGEEGIDAVVDSLQMRGVDIEYEPAGNEVHNDDEIGMSWIAQRTLPYMSAALCLDAPFRGRGLVFAFEDEAGRNVFSVSILRQKEKPIEMSARMDVYQLSLDEPEIQHEVQRVMMPDGRYAKKIHESILKYIQVNMEAGSGFYVLDLPGEMFFNTEHKVKPEYAEGFANAVALTAMLNASGYTSLEEGLSASDEMLALAVKAENMLSMNIGTIVRPGISDNVKQYMIGADAQMNELFQESIEKIMNFHANISANSIMQHKDKAQRKEAAGGMVEYGF